MATTPASSRNKALICFTKLVGVFQAALHFGFILGAVYLIAKHAHKEFHPHHHHGKHHHGNQFHEEAIPQHLKAMPMMHIMRMHGAMSFPDQPHHKQLHSTPVHIFWMRIFRIPIKKPEVVEQVAAKKGHPSASSASTSSNNGDDTNQMMMVPLKEAFDKNVEKKNFEIPLPAAPPAMINPKIFFGKAKQLFDEQSKTIMQQPQQMNEVNPFLLLNNMMSKINTDKDMNLPSIWEHGHQHGHRHHGQHHHGHHHHGHHHHDSSFHWHHKMFKCRRHMGLFAIVISSIMFLVAVLMMNGVVRQRPYLMTPFIIIHFACLIYSVFMFLAHLSYLPYAKFWIARMHHHVALKRMLLAMDTRLLSALILLLCIGYLLIKFIVCLSVYLCFRHLLWLNRVSAAASTTSVTVAHSKKPKSDEIDEAKAELKKKEAEQQAAALVNGKDVDMLKLPPYSESEGRDNKGMVEKEDEVKLIV